MTERLFPSPYPRNAIWRMAAMVAAYSVLHIFSLKISTFNHVGDIIWLPGGVALGFLLLFGIRLWPGVFLGALAGALLAHDPFPASLLAAIGNTLSPLAGAYFLTRCTRFDPSLKHVRDIGLLVLYGGLAASLLSALVGAPAFLLGNHIPLPQFPHLLLDWWMSDFIGVVILTPLMLLIAAHPVNTCRMLQRPWEGMAIPLGAVTVIILSRLYSDLFFSPSISLLLLVPFLYGLRQGWDSEVRLLPLSSFTWRIS